MVCKCILALTCWYFVYSWLIDRWMEWLKKKKKETLTDKVWGWGVIHHADFEYAIYFHRKHFFKTPLGWYGEGCIENFVAVLSGHFSKRRSPSCALDSLMNNDWALRSTRSHSALCFILGNELIDPHRIPSQHTEIYHQRGDRNGL